MRWFFLLFLVLNLFYYVWHQQQVPLRAKEVPAMEPYRGSQQDIRLLSESEGVPKEVPSREHVAGGEACLFLGGFQQEVQVRQLEQRLVSLDIRVELRSIDAAAGVDYWVYLAPLASRQASLRQLRELQARKIDSYIIAQGDLANGISLGIFPRGDSAQSVVRRLQDAGYEPLTRELPRAQRSYWLRVAPESRRLIDEPMLQGMAKDFSGLQHQLMPCETIATKG
ncbi:SPOR domain-containing protein [Pseudomonas sp. LRF_L74]|uniref:SPOR domain-containing protein n=1 Tax=Pseudomonas sp. LRF_L74 TaxID=3369422 RepID=UPI003F5F8C3D